MPYQVGVDVGGTFTDLVVANGDGELHKTKSPSTPGDEAAGILAGLTDVADGWGVDLGALLGDTEVIVVGTTVVTNIMLEFNGAQTGLITTKGFRDIIELRRGYREDYFDIRLPPPHPIVPRERRLGVKERIDYEGKVVIPLSEDDARTAGRRLRELGVESIAVCLLFSFINPRHELRVREILSDECPGVLVTLSCEILPQVREYERVSTTVVNAYARPRVEGYLQDLRARMRQSGFSGELFVMQSNGGMASIDYAGEHAVELLLSGPAGGVVAGAEVSALSGYRDVITMDLGGTSCDVCLVKDSEPASGTQAWVSRYRIATPMVDVHSVGAGGGSIAWIDDGGALRVGPRSARAVPGPVCYGRGGEEPTVTDADLVLGYISAEHFLGGRMKLDVDGARNAIEERIAKPLGLDVVEAASGIYRIANGSMSNALRHVTVARGRDPRDFALCVFGGAGAIHAGAQAQDLGIKTILVPKTASVLSAVGNQLANFRVTKVRSFIRRALDIKLDELNEIFVRLLEAAETDLGEQAKVRETLTLRSIDVRYVGQSKEVTVPIRSRTRRVTELGLTYALNQFHELHESLYSFKRLDHPVEVLNLRLDLVGVRDAARAKSTAFGSEDPSDARVGHRQAYFESEDGFVDAMVFDGSRLQPGHLIAGPAIIEEPDTTIVIHPKQEAMIDQYYNYVVELQ
ncbi:MAG: hydantoinase/oxoprolinase family protein [Solirubrobacteraceae bacterium]